MKKYLKNLLKFSFLSFGVLLLYIFNIWLINQGSGFTIPRELLFRSQAEILIPIIAFPIILTIFLLFSKFLSPLFKKINLKKKLFLIFIFCLSSALSLSWTVQTNPDYGRYHYEAKYLVENGIFTFFQNWGQFHYSADMPVMPFIYGVGYLIFGEGQMTILIINSLIFLGIIWLTYLIAKELFNHRVAFLSVFLLSTSPFVITQSHLFLIDLGQTLFLTLSFYLLINLIKRPSFKKSILIGLVLFLASLTKIFSILFLIVFFITSFFWLFSHKRTKSAAEIYYLSVAWIIMSSLDLIYILNKKNIFLDLFFRNFSTNINKLSYIFILLVILGITLAITTFIIKIFSGKNNVFKQKIKKANFLLLITVYFIILVLFLFGGRKAFYLRTLFIATNIPLVLLFYSSFFYIYRKKSLSALILLPWAFVPLLIPNTMFKYQLPSYPAIFILSAFSLVSLFSNHWKQIKYLLLITAFSCSITYFFFLPMIQNHVKNNIRDAAKYANQFQPKRTVVLFFPIGEYGNELSKYIDEKSKFPTPSLINLLDFYSIGEVIYETEDEFLEDLENDNLPNILILTTHLNYDFHLDKQLATQIEKYFIEGPTFEKANGAGIWRVKIKLYLNRSRK